MFIDEEGSKEYKFIKIKEIQNTYMKKFDVIGTIVNIGEITNVYSWKCNTYFAKKTLTIADPTGIIEATLWDTQAMIYKHPMIKIGEIVVLESVTVTINNNGYSLTSPMRVTVKPDCKETKELTKWCQSKSMLLTENMMLTKYIPISTPEYTNIQNIKNNESK